MSRKILEYFVFNGLHFYIGQNILIYQNTNTACIDISHWLIFLYVTTSASKDFI